MRQANRVVPLPFLIFVFLFPSFVCPGDGEYVRFHHLIPEREGAAVFGLSSMLQDKEGLLWFGTSMGLAKYNGYHFTFFSPESVREESTDSITVYPAIEDSSGDIWIGTHGDGLLRFDRDTKEFTRYISDPLLPDSLNGNIVLAVQEDRGGDLWIGTRLHGLARYDRESDSFSPVALDPELEAVWDLLVDRQGTLWVGTEDAGLFKVNPETQEFINYRFLLNNPRSLGGNTIWSIFEDSAGTIWIGTKEGGLNRYDPETDSFLRFTGSAEYPHDLARSTITAIAEDDRGRIWLGTSSKGLRIWDRETGEYFIYQHDSQDPDSLSEDTVTFIERDRSGIMWVGTSRGGINISLFSQVKFSHYKHNPLNPKSLGGNDVRSLYVDRDGFLWVGLDGGLEKIDKSGSVISRFSIDLAGTGSESPEGVEAVVVDRMGRIWLGTSYGLGRLDPRTGRITPFRRQPENPNSLSANRILSLWEDRQNPDVLWVGTTNGLNRFETRANRWTRFVNDPQDPSSLSGNNIRTIYEDRDGRLWVGTTWGLNKMDKVTGSCERYISDIKNLPGKSPNDNSIHCIHEDGSADLWIGTSRGLNRLDRAQGEWSYFTSSEGLPGGVVHGIMEDRSGNLWLSTDRGLSRFDPRNAAFTNYGIPDGIQDEQFHSGVYSKDPAGKMYFGGSNGYNSFAPEYVKRNPYIPPIAWTGFTVNDNTFSFGESLASLRNIMISYKLRYIKFEFAALYYADPARNQFMSRLEGLDDVWSTPKTENIVTLSNLRPGDYVLHVKAANPDGVWNEEELVITMRVIPAFWRTRAFAAIAVLFALFLVLLRRRIRKRVKAFQLDYEKNLEAVFEKFSLTTREQEILELVLQGVNNKDIAKKLFISNSTVRNHIYNIYQKLDVQNRLELLNRIKNTSRKKI